MKRLKYATVKTIFILLSGLLLSLNHDSFATASGDMADFSEHTTLTPEYIAKFYTDNKIDGTKNTQKCAQQVVNFRRRFNDTTRTLGVKPTVGLGAALIIFLLVGVFAAGIAQAFQLVSTLINFYSIS